jgi:hypothetical protein
MVHRVDPKKSYHALDLIRATFGVKIQDSVSLESPCSEDIGPTLAVNDEPEASAPDDKISSASLSLPAKLKLPWAEISGDRKRTWALSSASPLGFPPVVKPAALSSCSPSRRLAFGLERFVGAVIDDPGIGGRFGPGATANGIF